MKLVCNKELLLANLNIVSRAVSSRTTLPILECILLTCYDNNFTVFANDLSMSIESRPIDAYIAEKGEVALQAKLFYDIIRHLPEETVSIYTDVNYVTTITSGHSEFKILGVSGEEFPGMPKVERENLFQLPAAVLKDMIRQTIFSVSVDTSKPALTGELLEIHNGYFHVVAVDGFRVSYRRTPLTSNPEHAFRLIVPPKVLNEMSKIALSDDQAVISIFSTDNHVLFEIDDYRIVSRLIDGEFIKYDQVFTEDFNTIVTLHRQSFLMSLERVSIIASKELKKNPIHLSIQDNNILISSQTETGNVRDEIESQVEGKQLEISFNPRYLIDAVRVLEEDIITIQFTTPLSPCILKGVENPDGKYLVLPLRLKN